MQEKTTEAKILGRRAALGLISTLGAIPLIRCGGGGSGSTASSTSTSTATTTSSDATLSALALSAGSLSPAFSSSTTSYTASVVNSVTSVTVTATSTSSAATIKINGTTVASGAASGAISLSVGTTAITIVVTAQDGTTTETVTLSMVRASVTSGSNCALIPEETEGPYPLLAILSNSSIVRTNITETQTGVPLTLTLTFDNVNDACAPLVNAAVYIWQCNKDGEYSGYSSTANGSHLNETFLRGIQLTDSNGQVSFTTIYPGWYTGRITHVHVQVYLNDNLAVTATATTQLAFPQDITTAVYNSSLYATHGQNTSVTSFSADNVFSDGTTYQMMTVTGDTTNGYVATLNIGIAA